MSTRDASAVPPARDWWTLVPFLVAVAVAFGTLLVFDVLRLVAVDATGLEAAYSSGLALGEDVAVVGSSDDGYGVRVQSIDGATAVVVPTLPEMRTS